MAGKLRNLLRGLQYKPPTTDCEICRLAEGGFIERVRYYRREFFPTTAEKIHMMGHMYSLSLSAILGDSPRPLSPYEQHKRRYIETGDISELERMARHVTPAE